MKRTEQNIKKPIGLSVPLSEDIMIDRQAADPERRAHSYHYHNAYEMYYLFSGDRYYFIKDKTYHAKAGSLVLIKPYEIHCASNYSDEPYERMLISFKKEYILPLIISLGVDLFRPFENGVHIIELDGEKRAFTETLISALHSEYKSKNPYLPMLKSALLELLSIASKYGETSEENEGDFSDSVNKTVSAAAAFINNNYSDEISLTSLAERFYISPCYLSRTFKRTTGSSFAEYLNGVRIKEAQKLLLKTDMKISDISEVVGFRSVTHFGRAFKSVVGKSPKDYRKNT